MYFGMRLKQLRIEKGFTQKELGDKLNISDRVIGYYESEDRFPKDEQTLRDLSDIFDVSVDYLLGRTDNHKPAEPDDDLTIAAHHEGNHWTQEELDEIERFKEYIKSKRK